MYKTDSTYCFYEEGSVINDAEHTVFACARSVLTSIVGTIMAANIIRLMIASNENWASVTSYGNRILRLKKWDLEATEHVGAIEIFDESWLFITECVNFTFARLPQAGYVFVFFANIIISLCANIGRSNVKSTHLDINNQDPSKIVKIFKKISKNITRLLDNHDNFCWIWSNNESISSKQNRI